ncbi:MAG: hypothetical protein ACKO5R_11680 [Planctomycetaceae bacterium]
MPAPSIPGRRAALARLATAVLLPVALPRAARGAEPTFAEQAAAVRAGAATRIRVSAAPLADPEWEEVVALEGLAHLDLQEGVATDAHAARLAGLPRLERLVLRHSPLGDEGFRRLAACRTLRLLNVPQAACTCAGLEALAALPNLTSLRLGSPRLVAARGAGSPPGADADEGRAVARALLGLRALRTLHLIDVPLGDGGLDTLAGHEGLRTLYLDGAGISDAAWDRYFARRGDVHVHVDQAHHDRDPNRHE